MLTRDGNPTERREGSQRLTPKSRRFADHHKSQIPTQSSNADHHQRANASTQSDLNRSKQIGAFHSNRCWLEHVLSSTTKSCYANSVSSHFEHVLLWGPRGNGPICQLEHVHISSDRTQSRKKVLIRLRLGISCCVAFVLRTLDSSCSIDFYWGNFATFVMNPTVSDIFF